MNKSKRGFVVSAVLYPLLVLFLAIIMGLLSMTDTRKRILDKMKLEIEDSILDDATCSCETILAKLNYIIDKLDKGITTSNTGGQYAFNRVSLNVKVIEAESGLPTSGNVVGDIVVISDVALNGYYVSPTAPTSPQDGMIWIVQDFESKYYILSDWNKIGITHVMQWHNGRWNLKKAFVYEVGDKSNRWTLLYYVSLSGTHVDLSGVDINAETEWTYGYTGSYQTFKAIFSGTYEVQLWGAQGGSKNYAGGLGAYTKGKIYLNAGDLLYVYVGGVGSGGTGGWNGGGNGSSGAGGGGATDIRLLSSDKDKSIPEFESLKTRIMVAAGGGGANGYIHPSNSAYYTYSSGGIGGAYDGGRGYVSAQSNYNYSAYYGTGGTQSRPGYDSFSDLNADGVFGKGGTSTSGGGGGYYGGGGNTSYGGGGGGSSYISGHYGSSSIEEESISTNIIHNGSAYHYSGLYFTETKMVDGSGYEWNPDRSAQNGKMPNQAGTGTMNGNSGNGYAKIKMITVEIQESSKLKEYKDEKNVDFYYTYAGINSQSGNMQPFTAPKTGYYKVELWGAQGGNYNTSDIGGRGAYTSGSIYLEQGKKLYLYVGSTPEEHINAGWNGGGKGDGNGRGGGGATDVRLSQTSVLEEDFNSLKSRIMVAAGGGGADGYLHPSNSAYYVYTNGGAGGGLNGIQGTVGAQSNYNYSTVYGTGGTQVFAGYYSSDTGVAGKFGLGGNNYAGGGGGYYGGGPSAAYGAGGGGSSYISGHNGCSSIEKSSIEDAILHNGDATHYSGYYFINTKMIDGQGYEWSNVRDTSTVVNQPTIGGTSKQVGNNGDGKARIHLVSEETKTDAELVQIQKNLLNEWNYPYNGTIPTDSKYQIFTVPKNGYYQVNMCGGKGANATYSGGNGGCTSGKIYLFENEKFYVYVGGAASGYPGGWNGGGTGSSYGRGGGGATDIRTIATDSITEWNDFDSLKSRIMVAAGGGGANGYLHPSNSAYYTYSNGGTGGGIEGSNGYEGARSNYNYSTYYATGATQSRPGYYSYSNAGVGGFGYGGTYESGGGGGYYGGGGATSYGAAGGGSSYISGHVGCSSIEENSTEETILHNGSPYHYDGHYFIDTSMSGTNAGNGYAKIKFVSGDSKTQIDLDNDRISQNKVWHFNYAGKNTKDGNYQTFIVPKTGNYYFELWGAQGGNYNLSYTGGLGGYAKGKIHLVKGTKLYIYVGPTSTEHATAVWNGGGSASANGRSGGGSTDVRTIPTTTHDVWDDPASLKSRIIVAGAGGGADGYLHPSNSAYYTYSNGGTGGGLEGIRGSVVAQSNYNYSAYYGTGGTQVKAGQYSNNAAYIGGFGFGASQYAGGGGGWYGGGSSDAYGAGGGGSSYISGHRGCVGVDSSGNPNASAYTTYTDSVSYTNYEFTETKMIDGQGYEWTTSRVTTSVVNMPNYYGTAMMKGNSGDGHVKITFIGA